MVQLRRRREQAGPVEEPKRSLSGACITQTVRPFKTYQICFAASSLLMFLSAAMASRTWSAIPQPAVPAPNTTMRMSLIFCFVT